MNTRVPPKAPDDPDDPVAMAHFQNELDAWQDAVNSRSLTAVGTQIDGSPIPALNPNQFHSAINGNTSNMHTEPKPAQFDNGAIAFDATLQQGDPDDDEFLYTLDDDGEEDGKKASKQPAQKEKKSRGKGKNFGSQEYLLLARAYMKVSTDATTGADQKGDTFWNNITTQYCGFIEQANNINKIKEGYTALPPRTSESLAAAWGKRLQKAVGKFAGICSTCPPASGERKDDAKMDLYYSRMRELYVLRAKKVSGLPRKFDEMMAAFFFLSTHPKFKVHFPDNEDPRSARKASQASIMAPPRESRPAGRDKSKSKKVIDLTVKQVSDQVTAHLLSSDDSSTKNDEYMTTMITSLKQANDTMQMMAKHQVMSLAPSPQRKKYFEEVYKTNIQEANLKKQKLELEEQRLEIEKEKLLVEKMEIEKRKKDLEQTGVEVNDAGTNVAKCVYPDCAQTIVGGLDKCGDEDCDSGELFHHCCQIAYFAENQREITTKRCYNCAMEIVMGLNK